MRYLEDFRKTLSPEVATAYQPFFAVAQVLHHAFQEEKPVTELEELLAQYKISFLDGETERAIQLIFVNTPREEINMQQYRNAFIAEIFAPYFKTFEHIIAVYNESLPVSRRHAYERFQLEERQFLERLMSSP